MTLDQLIARVQQKHGYPRWIARILIELRLAEGFELYEEVKNVQQR